MGIIRISSVTPMSGLRLDIVFDDGREVIYDVGEDVDTLPAYAPLRTVQGLFEQVCLDQSRTCLYWNDQIDLPSDIVYEYGITVVPTTTKG